MKQSIWFKDKIEIIDLNKSSKTTMMETLDILYTEIGDDFIKGTMPISNKTVQPLRMLHGGASCVLAETLGSVASHMIIDPSKFSAFGQSITTNHIRPGSHGDLITGTATIIHQGRRSHIWNVDILDSNNKLISTTRLTMAVIEKR